jgi:hypothetical protein
MCLHLVKGGKWQDANGVFFPPSHPPTKKRKCKEEEIPAELSNEEKVSLYLVSIHVLGDTKDNRYSK